MSGIVKSWESDRQRFRVCVVSSNEKVFVKASNFKYISIPRFPIGEAVFINARTRWTHGRVIAHFYTQDHFPPRIGPIVPYQIETHDGELICAPADVDQCIRKRMTDFSELLQYLKENPQFFYDLSFMEAYFDSGLLDFRSKDDVPGFNNDEANEKQAKQRRVFEVLDTEGSSDELLNGSLNELRSSYTPCNAPSQTPYNNSPLLQRTIYHTFLLTRTNTPSLISYQYFLPTHPITTLYHYTLSTHPIIHPTNTSYLGTSELLFPKSIVFGGEEIALTPPLWNKVLRWKLRHLFETGYSIRER